MNRNVYILWFRPDEIVGLFRVHNSCYPMIAFPRITDGKDENGNRVEIPSDAYAVRSCYDWHRDAIGIQMEHHSFPRTEDGAHFPSLACTHVVVDVKKLVETQESRPVPNEVADCLGCGHCNACIERSIAANESTDWDEVDAAILGDDETEEWEIECPYCDDGLTGFDGVLIECGECGGTGWY